MNADGPDKHPKPSAKLHDALTVLGRVDGRRNLNRTAIIFVFLFSFCFAVLAFFIISDLLLWQGIEETLARSLIAVSWVLIIPIWVLTFLFVMLILDKLGIRSVARRRLSGLTLDLDELHELRTHLAGRQWRHGRTFERVIADLAKQKARAGSDKPVTGHDTV